MFFLGQGLKAMSEGNKVKSQLMMRGRVIAQGLTIAAIAIGGYIKFKNGENNNFFTPDSSNPDTSDKN